MGEFDLIRRYFQRPVRRAALGVGDDCALLAPAPGMQLAISSDMLVEGRHFFADVNPRLLGHKALAVNLSDLAASGARPLAFTLALSLPRADEDWISEFATGLLTLADAHDCELIGGDTTGGPLNICITVFGEVPAGQALLRSGARAGDEIWVSGTLGDARLALEAMLGRVQLPAELLQQTRQRLEAPTPRVALGLALLLESRIPLKSQFRTFFLSPMMVPVASVVLIWQVLFSNNGVINEFTALFGIAKIDWIKSEYGQIVILTLFLWKNLGYNMILFMSSLANIPRELLEVSSSRYSRSSAPSRSSARCIS